MDTTQKASKGSVGIESFQGRLRLRLPRQIYEGQQKYLTLGLADTVENRQTAEAKACQIELDIISGNFDSTLRKYKPATHLTLIQSIEQPQVAVNIAELWAKYVEYRKPKVSETTLKLNYKTIASHIDKLPYKELTESNSVAIRDYLAANNSAYTAKRVITQLAACCEWAVSSKLLTSNPFKGMAGEIIDTTEKEEIDPFTAGEREEIIKAFEAHPTYRHYASFVRFLFMTGCRTSEAVALQWKHIADDFSFILFSEAVVCVSSSKIRKDTKNHKPRKFPCNKPLRELLSAIKPKICESEKLVFPALRGGEINAHTFSAMCWKGTTVHGKYQEGIVSRLAREGKISHYRPQYNTRHTFITLALENGLDAKDVARLVGNSPEIIYKHYAGSNISKLEIPEF